MLFHFSLVSHRRAHPPATLHDPPVSFILKLTGTDQGILIRDNEVNNPFPSSVRIDALPSALMSPHLSSPSFVTFVRRILLNISPRKYPSCFQSVVTQRLTFPPSKPIVCNRRSCEECRSRPTLRLLQPAVSMIRCRTEPVKSPAGVSRCACLVTPKAHASFYC